MKNRIVALVVGALGLIAGFSAHAVDYTAAATSATTEVNASITAALPVGILVMAAVIGWRLFKRFAKG
ncbi:major coat protein [Sedimenticola sp.]|uniref:major coat protein n=1 Tax=Sedimenticola sp. TaxID=1940285 RepID=UPI003D0FE7B7